MTFGLHLVSFAAVFWMSRNAPPKEGGALRDIQKTAAKETSLHYANQFLERYEWTTAEVTQFALCHE